MEELQADEKLNIYNQGFVEGERHRKPALETQKYMQETNNKLNGFTIMINNIQNDIKNINKSLEDNVCQHKELLEGLKILNDKLDTKYASKWVEKALVAFGGAIGLSVLYALLELILKK